MRRYTVFSIFCLCLWHVVTAPPTTTVAPIIGRPRRTTVNNPSTQTVRTTTMSVITTTKSLRYAAEEKAWSSRLNRHESQKSNVQLDSNFASSRNYNGNNFVYRSDYDSSDQNYKNDHEVAVTPSYDFINDDTAGNFSRDLIEDSNSSRYEYDSRGVNMRSTTTQGPPQTTTYIHITTKDPQRKINYDSDVHNNGKNSDSSTFDRSPNSPEVVYKENVNRSEDGSHDGIHSAADALRALERGAVPTTTMARMSAAMGANFLLGNKNLTVSALTQVATVNGTSSPTTGLTPNGTQSSATVISSQLNVTLDGGKTAEARTFDFVRVNGFKIPHQFIFEPSCSVVLETGGCRCMSAQRQTSSGQRPPHTRCCCAGPQTRQIPQNFTHDLTAIYFYNVGILEIREDDFSEFPLLEEVVIDSARELRNVEGGAFAGLTHLVKIYISNCPNLERWSSASLERNRKLRAIVARDNALTSVPRLRLAAVEATAMETLDYSGNRITVIERHAFSNVSVRELRLDENRLERVEAGAFEGSHFQKISLNNNPELQLLSLEAFELIESLVHLDLSNTRIDRLPVLGLKNIERLTLRDVPTLKKLPPVLAFIYLSRADFTYPYHCCFFKHASRQLQNKRYYQAHYREIQHRLCRQRRQPPAYASLAGAAIAGSRPPSPMHKDSSQEVFDEEDTDSGENDLSAVIGSTARTILESMLLFFYSGEVESNSDESSDEPPLRMTLRPPERAECVMDLVSEFYSNITCSPQPDALNPCEDIVSYYPLRCVIWVMWISGIIGNIAVWIVIAAVWKRQMRLHYFFMLNVSFADFLTGVYLAILAIADWKTSNEYYNYAVEWQTGWGCSAAGFISVFASQLSIFSMLLIAVEIYYNAKYAFYGRRMSGKAACLLMGLGYTYAFTMAVLPLMGVSSYKHSSICLPLTINTGLDQAYILLGLSLSAAAFASMVANYAMINCMIRNREMPARDEDRQILRRTIVLIGTDMICWVPTLFLGITAALGMPLITLTNAKICLILFYPINSCANPLLYVFLTKIWTDAKRKALPILEIISSKSQNFSRYHHNNNSNNNKRNGGQPRRRFGRGVRSNASRDGRAHSDFIANFYYSAPPSPAAELDRRQSDGDFDNATRALLEDVRARIICQASGTKSPTPEEEQSRKLSASTPALDVRPTEMSAADESSNCNGSGGTDAAVTVESILSTSSDAKSSAGENSANSDSRSTSTFSDTSADVVTTRRATAPAEFLVAPAARSPPPQSSAGRARVSAVPEMSDISESSSNSCERLHQVRLPSKRQLKNDSVTRNGSGGFLRNLRLASHLDTQTAPLVGATNEAIMSPPPMPPAAAKRDSDTSIGQDSGRGDSLTSGVLIMGRPSVASIDWEKLTPLYVSSPPNEMAPISHTK